ncbi:voltage-dependent calcium channel gamma-8 subunit-like [Littorina saxatilis]|uniref:voltage-dependent calcium channel gamma-8 subunit-like n=1 Tax=Littorina saxatilis TaxID=31220 RepID=UPI0038B4855D
MKRNVRDEHYEMDNDVITAVENLLLLQDKRVCINGIEALRHRKNKCVERSKRNMLKGLCTLVGIILYIGSITEEVGNKPRASIEEPKFIYTYGSSFIMAVGSFVLTELSGVFAVYLYITRHKQAQRKKLQALKAQHNDRGCAGGGPGTWRYRKPTRDRADCAHSASQPASRDRSQSRDRSRDPSASRSETYFTYTPISDASHELSNYTFQRDGTDNTISTTAEMHQPRGDTYIGATAPSIDIVRRTTPV